MPGISWIDRTATEEAPPAAGAVVGGTVDAAVAVLVGGIGVAVGGRTVGVGVFGGRVAVGTVVAVGTGQALDIGRRGDADALFVHDRPAEDKFVAEGYGSYRKDVMYNDFVFIGPRDDGAKIRAASDAVAALKAIAASGQPFVSRGDKSGTHAAELRLWKQAGVDPKALAAYKETGSGMGPTLNMAAALNAYTLSDRATWGAFRNRQNLDLLLAGDAVLFNPYGVIPVNPVRHPHVKKDAAERFAQWLTSSAGQEAIAAFRADGQQVFFPNAK